MVKKTTLKNYAETFIDSGVTHMVNNDKKLKCWGSGLQNIHNVHLRSFVLKVWEPLF